VQHATAVARVVIRPIALLSILVYPLGKICTGLVNGRAEIQHVSPALSFNVFWRFTRSFLELIGII